MARKNISNLMVGIGLDLTQFEKSMQNFQRDFGRLGAQVQEAGQQIGFAFGGVSAAITAGLASTVKKAAEFEVGLSSIKALTGATGEEMETMKALALQMGADTKYSATEAALGIEELVKAGVSLSDITNGGLKGALSLATAGGIELAQAAEIASTALNAFRAENLTVSQAANVLAGAANASATSVEELQFGLAQVSAVASMVGMTFEDTSAALAVFAQNGLKGSDAGTSLKTLLMTLQPSTKEQTRLFKELGLTAADGSNAFYDAAGNLKSLDAIADILKKSLDGMSAAQAQATLKTLFGTDAVRAASILYKEGADGVNKMKDAMSNVTAEEVAAEKTNNLNGAIEQLKGAFETLQISLGETLVPSLRKIAESLGGIVNWFNKLSPATKKIIVITATFIAITTGLIAVIGFLTMGLGALAVAEWAVILPILGIIAAVVAVIAIFIALGIWIAHLYKQNESFRDLVQTVWGTIKTVIETVASAIMPILASIWSVLKENLLETWQTIQPALAELWHTIKDIFGKSSGFIKNNMGIIKTIITYVYGFIGTFIKVQLGAIFGVIKFVLNAIITTFRFTFNLVKGVVLSVFNFIKTAIQIAMNVIKGIIKTVTAIIKGDWQGAWNAIKETVSAVFDNLKDYFANMKDVFFNAGAGMINAIIDGVKGAKDKLVDTFKGVMKSVRDFLPFSPAKVGPLSDLDKLDFGGPISQAMEHATPSVQASMNSMLQLPNVAQNTTSDSANGTTIIMQLDGKTIAKKTFEHLGGTFRVRGAVT